MSVEISQADSLREWIEKRIDEKYDYSKASYKKKDRIEFCKSHPEFGKTEKDLITHHTTILKEEVLKTG